MPVNILPCSGCGASLDCSNLDPSDLYSLQSENFPFLTNCPSSYNCTGANELRMICCGQELVASYPPGATYAQRLSVVSRLWQQCAVLLDFCAGLPASSPARTGNPPDDPPGHEDGPAIPPAKTQLFYSTPQTCTKVCPDSSVFNYTTPAGLYLAQTQEQANDRAFQFACQQVNLSKCPPCRTISLSSLPTSLCLSNAYSLNVVATGDTVAVPPATNDWSLTGSLPPGMVFHGGDIPGNALLDGTPTTAGSYTFTVTVRVSQNCAKSKAYTIVVRGITTDSRLDDASPNEAYSQTLASTGFTGTLVWSFVSGSFPSGLSLNSATGEISGLPTTIGDFTATIQVTDGTHTCSKVFHLSCFSYSGKRINAWKRWCGFSDLRNTYSNTNCDGNDAQCPVPPASVQCNKRWLTMTLHQVWDNAYLHDDPGPGTVPGVDDTYIYRFNRYNCENTPGHPQPSVTETHLGQWIGDAYTQALNCTSPGCGICPTGCGTGPNPSQLFTWTITAYSESHFHVDIDFQVNISEAIFHGSWDITLSDPYDAKDVQDDLIALWAGVNPDVYAWASGVFDVDVTYRPSDQKIVQYCPSQPAVIPPLPAIQDAYASASCNATGVLGQPLTPPLSALDPYYDFLGAWLFAPTPNTCVNLVKTIIRYRGDFCIRDWAKPLPLSNPPTCDPNWASGDSCLNDYSTSLLPITVLPIAGVGPYTYATGFRRILLDCALQEWWKMEEASGVRVDAVSGIQLAEITSGTGSISRVSGIIHFGAEFTAPAPGGFPQSLQSIVTSALAYRDSGISISGWFKWATVPVFDDKLIFTLQLNGGQSVIFQVFQGTSLAQVFDGTNSSFVNVPPFTPIQNAWNFFYLSYDRNTQFVSLRMNGGPTIVSALQANLTSVTNAQFTITAECGDPVIDTQIVVDEVGIWLSSICPTVSDFLWNSGAGRTYPL